MKTTIQRAANHLRPIVNSVACGDVCNIGWRIIDQALFKHWVDAKDSLCVHAHIIQQSWIIIVSLINDLCACMRTSFENGITNEDTVLQWPVWIALWDFKKRWAGALLSVKCCCLCENHHDRVMQFWTSPSEDEKEEEEEEERGCLVTFWFSTFVMFCASGCVVHHETLDWGWMEILCIIIYCVSTLSLL